jgi:phage I-like protein
MNLKTRRKRRKKKMELREELKTGDKIEIEIMPLSGQYKATTVDGTPFVEKFSVESGELIVENWKKDGSKEILCDIDHSSVDTNDTAAAGWVTDLWVDKDAMRLKGTLQVSEKGARLLNGVEYRYLSPVLLFTEDNFPYYLDSVSLTNTPRLEELKAVYNSRTANTTEETPEKETIMDINELKTILGLPEEATEEDIRNTLAEIMAKLKANAEAEAEAEAERIRKEAEEAEAKLEEEAEEAVNECGIEDEEKKAEVKNSYKQNPALVKSVLNAVKTVRPKMVINSEEANRPVMTETEKLMKEYNALPGGQAKIDFMMSHKGLFA